jgi:50S ribosomal subunit-associated GTPase HflX
MIIVLNKIDRLGSGDGLEALLKLYPESVPVSAVNGTGLAELCTRIASVTGKGTNERNITEEHKRGILDK